LPRQLDVESETVKNRLLPALAAAWLAFASPLRAHVGSPAVVYDGAAGPYPVRVIILPPPVVPGRAQVTIRLLRDEPAPVRVTIRPVNGRLGLVGSPAPDEARPVRGDSALRQADLWLMTSGSYSVEVTVSGERGAGTVMVPVLSVSTRRLTLSPILGTLLAGLGALLVASGVALASKGAMDSVRPADTPPVPGQAVRGWVAAGLALLVFGAALYLGKRWWDREDENYRMNELYRPVPMDAALRVEAGQRILRLSFHRVGETRLASPDLLPDHGKLIHLFMIREPDLDAFAHVHPLRVSAHYFDLAVPPLPPGHYQLYGDLTFERGFAATLTTTIDLPPPLPSAETGQGPVDRDPDDAWSASPADLNAAGAAVLTLTGPAQIRAGQDLSLNFAAHDAAGRPAELELYMGMPGHAAIRRSDGSVFAHIHPVGTISMASQFFFEQQAAAQTGGPMPVDHSRMAMEGPTGASTVAFPYLFPQPGAYRIWVQTKIAGRIVTGAFDVTVAPAR
jgi:hypothetical protein